MADISVTAANVQPVTTGTNPTQISYGTLGATVTAGQTVYEDVSTSPSTIKLADANASVTTANTKGIAMNGGSTGQPVAIAIGGDLTVGGTSAAGAVYVQSATAGGIAVAADLATGHFTTLLGVGKSATVISINIKASGVAVP